MDDYEEGGRKDPERERRQEPRHDHDAEHEHEREHEGEARLTSTSFRRRPAPGKSNSAYKRYAGIIPTGESERVDWSAARELQLRREKERNEREPTVLDPGALQDLGFAAWDQTDVLERAWSHARAPAQNAPADMAAPAPAKVLRLVPSAPQDAGSRTSGPAPASEIAARGFAGPTAPLPHRDEIQRAFGGHDVSGVTAHVGGPAAAACDALGAEAYASGDHVVFRTSPDVHT